MRVQFGDNTVCVLNIFVIFISNDTYEYRCSVLYVTVNSNTLYMPIFWASVRVFYPLPHPHACILPIAQQSL